jgi:hypothetical protein
LYSSPSSRTSSSEPEKSEKLQREAVERGRQSVPKIEESVAMQKESLAELRKTNQLLAEIASALKSRNENEKT